MKPHFSHTHCPRLFSTAEIKARTRRNLGRREFILAYRWRKPKQSLKQRPQRNTASWLALVACPLCFLIQPRTTCRDEPPTVGWAAPSNHQSGKCPRDTLTGQSDEWYFLQQIPLPTITLLCVKLTKQTNKNNNKNLPTHPPKQLWKTCKTKCFTGTQSAIQRPCLGLVRKNICDLMCTFIQHINSILETKT